MKTRKRPKGIARRVIETDATREILKDLREEVHDRYERVEWRRRKRNFRKWWREISRTLKRDRNGNVREPTREECKYFSGRDVNHLRFKSEVWGSDFRYSDSSDTGSDNESWSTPGEEEF